MTLPQQGLAERRRYSETAVQEILKRAVGTQSEDDTFSRENLLSMAEELGIAPAQLDAAERAWQVEHAEEAERQAFRAHRRREWRRHASSFFLFGGFFLFLNVATGGGFWWFIFPLMGWMPGMVGATWELFFETKGDSFDRKFAEWRTRDEQGEMAEERQARGRHQACFKPFS